MDSLKVETVLTKGGKRYHLAPRDETLVLSVPIWTTQAANCRQSFDKGFFLAVKAIQVHICFP